MTTPSDGQDGEVVRVVRVRILLFTFKDLSALILVTLIFLCKYRKKKQVKRKHLWKESFGISL